MSPRTKKIALFASVLVAGLLTFGALAALPAAMHHHGGVFGDFGFGHRAARALSALELTDEQKSQVKGILRESGPAVEPLVDEVLRSKRALFDAVHAATFDEQAVRDAASAAARAGADLAVEKARIVSRVRGLLTAEQQEKLEAIHQEFEARFLKHIGLARDIWREHAEDFIDEL
jgi:Spy/CpxP family protein refolding chaperone